MWRSSRWTGGRREPLIEMRAVGGVSPVGRESGSGERADDAGSAQDAGVRHEAIPTSSQSESE